MMTRIYLLVVRLEQQPVKADLLQRAYAVQARMAARRIDQTFYS